MKTEILTSIIGIGGTILGFILSEVSSYFKRKKDETERYLMANYTQRQSVYAIIYKALIQYQSYFRKFVEYGNEFVEHEDTQNFGPLTELEKFNQIFEENEIWLHNKTIEELKEVLSISSSAINVALFVTGEEDIWLSQVEKISNSIINKIEEVKHHIKSITGMNLIDNYQSKLNSSG
ncbi:hypothetical protein P4H94_14925 [Paenibacillus macerans]|uniref:Uncharacterized protein n=1 Tax=Paenibacillus macerans TaxID=44252 RepID=A0A090ZCF7_PAEMA|nr:hypothetical protein [Paenibacillus macerans]KFN08332.1 hypothetical protein DJ90_1609 [Paenibacillus macerans]MBS5914725.1 hypothetical protein [Paenibacillus macerans]MCY7557721.1 hypothetical protein [Paenibacillus macerans]MEC0138151.1 hypothetical protein [Paenibacillus macerans]MEC0152406.1 hypothetical protein [Paenibacillus macerans]